MGVTIESKNFSIDLGYGGFGNLRKRVAELTGKEIGEHYAYLDKGCLLYGEERTKFFTEYDKKTNKLMESLKIPHQILSFLYASDCNSKTTLSTCRKIYKVIENYDDNILYGYSGRPDCAMFKDFKRIVKDCIDNKRGMRWS